MKTAFIYTDAYSDFDYGPTHPLKIIRLRLAYELIRAYGLLSLSTAQTIPTQRAGEDDLALFHSREYLKALKEASKGNFQGDLYAYGLGPGDNPVFPGLYEWSGLVTGATLQAVDFVAEGKGEIAFNVAGGLHHAMPSRASGFCYINDPVIGILRLLKRNLRVAYIDIDAHHGDGVQKAFYGTNRVLTVSFHETGNTLFPGSGFEYEIGEGEGEGYSVNVPFSPNTDDEIYFWAFEEVVPPLIDSFRPDVVVTQLGVDTFFDDPLANLGLSIRGFEQVVRRLKELAPRWVALGGGGYNISNVARAWTLAWAVMNGVELSDELPEKYLEISERAGVHEKRLRSVFFLPSESRREESRREAERVVRCIKESVFPRVSPKTF
jgi:acetoin utilization protein AcuC